MAGVTTAILAGTALASTGAGIYKTVQGNKQMKKAQQNIESYERQTLENTLAGVDVPYQMYETETRQVQQRAADAASVAAQAGARGMALLPVIQNNEFEQQEVVNARLEDNLYKLSLAQAQEEQRIQQMTERREMQDLAGYGAMYEAGRQTKYSGIGDVLQGFQSIAGIAGGMTGNGTSVQPAGGVNPSASFYKSNIEQLRSRGNLLTGETMANPFNRVASTMSQSPLAGSTSVPKVYTPDQKLDQDYSLTI